MVLYSTIKKHVHLKNYIFMPFFFLMLKQAIPYFTIFRKKRINVSLSKTMVFTDAIASAMQ